MDIMIGIWVGALAATALIQPEAFGRFADDFWRNITDGLDWLMGRR